MVDSCDWRLHPSVPCLSVSQTFVLTLSAFIFSPRFLLNILNMTKKNTKYKIRHILVITLILQSQIGCFLSWCWLNSEIFHCIIYACSNPGLHAPFSRGYPNITVLAPDLPFEKQLSAVPLRFFSINYSRKTTSFFFAMWLAMWPFLFEKINKTKVIFSGEIIPAGERALLISNHRTEVDWMYLWDLALRKGRLGCIKYVLKSSLMKLPVFGWAFQILEFIPVQRKWEIDEPIMHQMLSSFKHPQDPLWLALFPEGTDFTEQKCLRSQEYAAKNGLPILTYVLLPKTKGFYACLGELRASVNAVYDVTIGYKHRCPSFLDNVFGIEPSEVHIHIRRIKLDDIPISENEVSSWLMDTFSLKDKLLSDFRSQGHFPNEGIEGELSSLKCIFNALAVIFLTGTCTYLTVFSSIWFKVYVVVACVYLAFATYFNIRPCPLALFMKEGSNCKQCND